MNKRCIIYRATNKINGKVYIGYTSLSLKERKSRHLLECGNPKYHNSYFKNAIKKYGIEEFNWEILASTWILENAYALEKDFIQEYKSFNKQFGYNSTLGGEGSLGLASHITPHTEKTKKLMSEKVRASNIRRGYGSHVLPVIAIDLNTGLPLFFNSIVEASRKLNISFKRVYNNLKDKNQLNNYKFILQEVSVGT